jgi:antitoxin component of MazEF toxin-antitoxin module
MNSAAAADDIPCHDWQGVPITAATCGGCAHAELRRAGGCEPGRSCMQDAYARRIDRFFRTHRALANQHLAHPYFEVRAIAARHADLFRLPPLMADPDETVRLQVALRVPQRLLRQMRADPHREVRIRVAHRIDVADLASMIDDPDYQVRCIAAQRLPEALLPRLLADADLQVRLEVARRIGLPARWRLLEDPAPEVRRIAAQRLPEPALGLLARSGEPRGVLDRFVRRAGAALQQPGGCNHDLDRWTTH